jgi:hypothetical protein
MRLHETDANAESGSAFLIPEQTNPVQTDMSEWGLP